MPSRFSHTALSSTKKARGSRHSDRRRTRGQRPEKGPSLMLNQRKAELLAESSDMTPVQGTVEVDIPIEVLWKGFTRANCWPGWNRCFFWVQNHDLVEGQQLIWCFQPIRWWYLYKMPAIAKIVEVKEHRRVTWEVVALPGFYARHTYRVEDLGNGRTRFSTWEQAIGWSFRLTKKFWVTHFMFVKDQSLQGVRRLEAIYRQKGNLQEQNLPCKHYWPFLFSLLLLPLLVLGIIAYCFYRAYLRQRAIKLAPGVHAVFGGGGNSLVVQDGNDVLLVDTKFPPASGWLRNWIARTVGSPVTKVVNTHYHYDHTQGNILYPGAQIIAHKNVPALMLSQDGDPLLDQDGEWWSTHRSGLPTMLLDGRSHCITVGDQEVMLTHPDIAHTQGDLWVYLPEHNILATGDIFLHTYYTFFDRGKGGTLLPGLIQTVRTLADRYPAALFVPGHGPLADAAALHRYVNYLEFLNHAVESAYKHGLSEDEAVRIIDLSAWKLRALPSFHHYRLSWATARNNIRWVYHIAGRLFR